MMDVTDLVGCNSCLMCVFLVTCNFYVQITCLVQFYN